MSTEPSADLEDERTTWSPWAIAAAVILLLIFGIIAAGTMRGWFFVDPQTAAKQDEEKKKKEEEEKKNHKQEFEIFTPTVMPAEAKSPIPFVKPGHWHAISQDMLANARDFVGDSRMLIVDAQNRPYPIPKTPFDVRTSRPVLLTKGRPKATETTIFVPETTQPVHLSSELEERSVGFGIPPTNIKLTAMPSYQYNFIVLAKEPARYGFLKSLDSVVAPFDGELGNEDSTASVLYRVVPLKAGQTVGLPDNPLTWTSIAYVLWDNVDPGDPVTPEQEKALIDWLNWGGQLVINGPDSLDLLKGSFLEPYLPATNGGQRKIEANDESIAELNKNWMISTKKTPGEPLVPKAPWSAINLNLYTDKADPHNNARWLPNTGKLLAERQIGRGRIVVSAIQLSERDFINWRSGFESLFNACVLRRPPRQFLPGEFGGLNVIWAEEKYKTRRLDAGLNSHLRFFSRDLGVDTAYHYEDVAEDSPTYGRGGQTQQNVVKQYQPPSQAGGVGAWNDFSATADAARLALREAAGVEVPGSDFVVLCLAAYLAALVPLNWIIFRVLGRVEWAWIAAPIIALIGTWVIVQRARLDIGFVRAQTEIGVLEQQPEHARAHLSRYTALYTSLSTTYDLQSQNATTLFAPFPNSSNYQALAGEGLTPVNFQRYDDVRLVGLPISSNSTGFVHGEQMHTLDGPIRLGKSTALGTPQVENRTKLELHSVCIVRRPTHEEETSKDKRKHREFEGRWIGDLMPGQSAPTSERMSDMQPVKAFADKRTEEARLTQSARLNLEPMFRLALDPANMEEGETRLVARTDEILPDQTVSPAASQVKSATLVVVHLQYADREPPKPDTNTRRDVKATDDSLDSKTPLE